MENILKLKGRVLDSNGNPVENKNIRMAIIDKDSIYDDFIAYGFLREGGLFDVDVYHSEFNQDPFEHEEYPQIYLVFYLVDDETNTLIPFEKIDKTKVPFLNNVLDLGDIKLNNLTNNRISKVLDEKFLLSRSLYKNVHLKIDDDLVKYCVNDVLPFVKQYTGWNDILDSDVVFIVTNTDGMIDALKDVMEKYFADEDVPFINGVTKLFIRNYFKAMGGMYNPFDKKLLINKEALKYVNMDRFKLIIAHELVHVGQFKNDDGLLKEYDGMIRNLVNKIRNIVETGNINSDMINKLIDEINNGIMHHIESQAAHIEKELFENIYTMATVFYHRSFVDMVLQSFILGILPDEYKKMFQSIIEGKMKQYK